MHSLSEHAAHTIQAADIAMTGVTDLLRYQNPVPERFNKHLSDTAAMLTQIRELGVLDPQGNWRFSSAGQTPTHNNSDRPYFIFHRDNPSRDLRISEPMYSRFTGRLTVLLSRRITRADGSFGGIAFAAIDTAYLNGFYNQFDLGRDGAISLVRDDGTVLVRTPVFELGMDVSNTDMFKIKVKQSPTGFARITSPFDGLTKYYGYEKAESYPLYIVVAMSEAHILARWWAMLGTDALITGVQLAVVILLAAMLSLQFRRRLRTEKTLRERESYFRLLTENIADVVLMIDLRGNLRYVSHSVEDMLGYKPQDLIGQSCFGLVHPDDRETVQDAAAHPSGATRFRTFRADGAIVWVEINFRTGSVTGDGANGFICVLRDVTERKRMEDELTKLNSRLSQLATTDGLTGLPNRRTFDGFLRREYETAEEFSVILFDIDHFKGFNDAYGHQAGDRCLQSVAKVIGDATEKTHGLSARYGGEEFAVVLPGVKETDAIKVAEAIRLTVRALAIPHSSSSRGYVTVSAGVAGKYSSQSSEAAMVGEADVALYEAKRVGRNRVMSRTAMDVEFHAAPPLQPGDIHTSVAEQTDQEDLKQRSRQLPEQLAAPKQ
ncbi:MAG: diguanylate cyclase [Pseudomonadota bacterium]